jgi:uncharacterized protein (TIGR00369 family)
MDGFAGTLGVREAGAEDGHARVEFDVGEEHLNPAGTLHGGVLATIVDTAMGLAARSTTGEGEVPATSQLTVTYLRPGRPGPLAATAQVRKQGEHLLVCDAEVEQEGRPLVHALATFAVVRR